MNASSREEALFQAAAQRSAAERAALLDLECADNPALRERIEALLAAHDQPDTLFGIEASGRRPLSSMDAADDLVGQTLGRYKLLEKIGEGGCGVVYVAEQTEPMRRRVALKIIKLGMDTRQVVARFEAERQALAMMDHPNIAKVLDAGTTEGGNSDLRTPHSEIRNPNSKVPPGRPYFVMELVRGIKITDYCERNDLGTKDRLDLFIKVCHAIQHAHQKGIIHRDIKPSNILVTLHDGIPVPKVIDFGIAKATGGRLTDATVYTQLHQFIGTPAYMSPEQAEMSGLDVDTRSDIYSLGVLLYELLTGTPPFDPRELLAQGLDAMRRTIREKEPPRPSTRATNLRATGSGRSDIRNPKSEIEEDLDWIVMKCLEKDRGRRYETANGLAADLKRHLGNEPVVARPPSAAYRFQKTFRRHKLAFTAGAVTSLALGVGLGLSLWQWQAAVRAGRLAEQRALAERQAREEATRERENAQEAHARVATLLSQLETQKADELLLNGKSAEGMAYLARALREHPDYTALTEKVIAALTHLSFAWPRVDLAEGGRLRFSPDGRRFLTVSNTAVHVRDLATGRATTEPLIQPSAVQHAEFSADGRRIVTAVPSPNRTSEVSLQVWDATSGQALGAAIASMNGHLISVGFSPDGRWVMAAGSQTIQIWDALTQRPYQRLPWIGKDRGFKSARFSPGGQRILTTSSRGIQAWDASTGQQLAAFSDDSPNPVVARGVQLSPDAERWLKRSERTVRTFEVATGRLLAEISPGHPLTSAEFSPDGQRLLTVSSDRIVRLWDSGTGQSVGEWLRHDVWVIGAVFSPHGQWVLTLCIDGTARVWDAFDGRLLIGGFALPRRDYHYARSAMFSPDGRFVAVQFGEFGDPHRVWELSMAPNESDSSGMDASRGGWGDDDRGTGQRLGAPLGPVPSWFPDMIEAIGGLRLTSVGTLSTVPFGERLQVRIRALEASEQDPYGRVAHWLLGDHARGVVSPFSAVTVEAHVAELIRRDRLESLRNALRLSPVNALAMARMSVHLAAQDPLQNPRRTAEAEYLSRRALALDPEQPEVWLLRCKALTWLDQEMAALALNEAALRRFPGHPELWHQRGDLLERAAQHEPAEKAYSRALELTPVDGPEVAGRRGAYLLSRSDARERQGRSAEASADRLEGLRILEMSGASDSPQWGGNDPGRNLYAPATGLPATFGLGRHWLDTSDVGLRRSHGIRFVLPLGSQSYEGPAVARGKVFVGTNNDVPRDPKHRGDRSILMCFDERTGAFLWQLVVPKLKSGKINDWENLGLLSTPAVEGNRVYLATTRGEILCLTTEGLAKGNVGPFKDEASYIAGPGNPPIEPGPKDADIVWRYDMMDELGVFPHNATRSQVLIVGDLLYVGTCNGVDWTHVNIPSPHSPSLIALNKHTGELAGEDDAAIGPRILHGQWSSPSTGRVRDRQLVFYGGGDGVCYAFDAVPVPAPEGPRLRKVWWADCNPPEYKHKDGKPIKYPNADGPSEIHATPVFWKDRVYVAIGQDPEHGEGVGNLVCLDATQEGDITRTGLLWAYRKIHRSLSTVAITPEGLLFTCDFSGFVHCLDAETGQPHWTHDMKAHVWSSPLVADGKVYLGDEDGDFVVFAASREKRVLSTTIRDGDEVDGPNLGAGIYSTPVVANGVVYINSVSHLFALEATSKGTGAPAVVAASAAR